MPERMLTGQIIGSTWLDRHLAFWSPGWTIGGFALAVLLAIVLGGPLADRAEVSERVATAYTIALGGALAWTLSPRSHGDRYFVFEEAARSCVLFKDDLLSAMTTPEWLFNLVLFAPVGCACAFADHRRAQRRLLAVAASAPVVVEAVQYMVMALHRVCEGTDVLTNWLGLVSAYALTRVARRDRLLGTR